MSRAGSLRSPMMTIRRPQATLPRAHPMGRHWLLLPDLFPHSVVSFYWKDDARAPGRSWRIRDYSSGGKEEHGPTHIDMTHSQILARARWEKAAPAVAVDDRYWVSETRRLNDVHGAALRPRPERPLSASAASAPTPAVASVPMLDEATLRRLRKGKALDRILTSPNSEDWVSWTVFRTLERQPAWWPNLLRLANVADIDATAVPTVTLWRALSSPRAYEKASRARMAASTEDSHRERAGDPKPVEGNTEVDIVIEGPGVLWFLEAKLHSDLSASTTYDPTRNQLARNIDVLLERAGGRRALMSLVVLDRQPDRFHTQLVARYRADPGALHVLLPHRPLFDVEAVVRDLRVVQWGDLVRLLGDFEPLEVRRELLRRCLMPDASF